jgi:mannose-1-phosphate guanylyltransferase
MTSEAGTVIERQWGHYKVLHEGDGYTVKELTILPGKSLSDQRHFKRDEHWLVVKGKLTIDHDKDQGFASGDLSAGRTHKIPKGIWHRPHNDGTENVVVVETWLGESTEQDIERR